jgi:hypothetical protein
MVIAATPERAWPVGGSNHRNTRGAVAFAATVTAWGRAVAISNARYAMPLFKSQRGPLPRWACLTGPPWRRNPDPDCLLARWLPWICDRGGAMSS